MSNFDLYSKYYDTLYDDKDYRGEIEYVETLIREYGVADSDLLELGCGTGKHAMLLAQKGYSVQGVDLGAKMIDRAKSRQSGLEKETAERLTFCQGDVRNIRLDRTFGSIISLFHVMCYQVSNEDLFNAFKTVSLHLSPGGVFVFDAWYGPAVLTEKPASRVKRISNELIDVTRIAEPENFPNSNRVDVNYELFIRERGSAKLDIVSEKHAIRYLFIPEVRLLLENLPLDLVHVEEWMTRREPGLDTWGVCFVVRKDG